VGKKTAERIVLELRGKLPAIGSEEAVARMERDRDVLDALVDLGYSCEDAKRALAGIEGGSLDIGARLRAALKVLKKK
jgi:Holliday junction DNA helicase RuvA